MARRTEQDKAIAVAFGQRVKQLRKERDLTQERLAEVAGLHPTFVSNLERGRRVPSLPTVVRMADALEVRLGELLDAMERREASLPQPPPSRRRQPARPDEA